MISLMHRSCLSALLCALAAGASAQQSPVTIQVNATQKLGPFKPAWAYFGYDEPNYTYAKDGRKLIGELADLSYTPVHIRTHNLLTTGDGKYSLKWGSTNAYTEDASGKPVYDWTIVDKILDTYRAAGAKPFVEIGFMPKALSTHPEPYRHNFPDGDIYTGWAYPPNDYKKWSELVYRWVAHCVEKYGKTETASWEWEVWNEPNIGYWHGTPEEYDKLYDYTVDAVRRALPDAKVGGPASTGPAGAKAAAFLRQFLEHCSSGKNAVSGKTGAPLDFISFHAKGRPTMREGHVAMGLAQEMKDVSQGFEIVRSFSKFKNLPIVLSEADPEGCAACSVRTHPQNAYRNGTLYPAYTAAAMKGILDLEARAGTNLEGILTWAFEFEEQPYFDGFRDLATNGVDKPVLNFFRMAGLMRGERVKANSSGAVALDATVQSGAPHPQVDALAVSSERSLSVLVWNYQDDDTPGPAAPVKLSIAGLPANVNRTLLRHYRIDQEHSNAYSAWKAMGSPQKPSDEQQCKLEDAGQLQLFNSPRWASPRAGQTDLAFSLPLQGISLITLSW
jgi:xylan 1,4-beta-xylosidase